MPSTATVSTTTTCSLIRIPAADFLRVLSDAPNLMQPLLKLVAGGLARSHPSYRLAAEESSAQSAAALLAEIRTRFAQLPPDERGRFVDGIRAILNDESNVD
jgi:CRP-like cAMP-binding protein